MEDDATKNFWRKLLSGAVSNPWVTIFALAAGFVVGAIFGVIWL